jgi:hypothetical protein
MQQQKNFKNKKERKEKKKELTGDQEFWLQVQNLLPQPSSHHFLHSS